MEILAGVERELITIIILQIDCLIARTVLGRPHANQVPCMERTLTEVRAPILPRNKSVSNTLVLFNGL